MREGYGNSVLDLVSGLFALRGGNEIRRTQLIAIAPAAPIGKFFHIPIDIGLGHRMIVLRERNQAGGE
jgi:hypothetical protein